MAIVVEKTLQFNSNYAVSKRITKISVVFAPRPQAMWRQNKVLKWRGGPHSDVFPCQEIRGPRGSNVGQKSLSSHLWPSEPCAPQREAQKGVSQVILHMLLSGFFNTCSFCFCHPARHGDINLWLADSPAQVSAYSSEHIRTLGFPERIRPFCKLYDKDLSQAFFFFPAVAGPW